MKHLKTYEYYNEYDKYHQKQNYIVFNKDVSFDEDELYTVKSNTPYKVDILNNTYHVTIEEDEDGRLEQSIILRDAAIMHEDEKYFKILTPEELSIYNSIQKYNL